ncbi:MAG: hypothetical protein MAG458_00194 [Nitrosopumilus sp.]|nr:hypothetical protein [Nitrosopumilus sp.]
MTNDFPDSVFSSWLSLISLNCWTSYAISEPYVAVAMRQPPPLSCESSTISDVSCALVGTVVLEPCATTKPNSVS